MFPFQINYDYRNRDAESKTAADVKFVHRDVDTVSMQKHLKRKKQLENEKQNEMIIPEWLFKEEQAPI